MTPSLSPSSPSPSDAHPFPIHRPFLTFIQFAFVACQSLPSNVTFTTDRKITNADGEVVLETRKGWLPRLKKRQVPINRWIVQVALYFTVSYLNNLAFGFNVPVALHIIFRSGGSAFPTISPPIPLSGLTTSFFSFLLGLAISMLTNYLFNHRRYPPLQIISVLLVSTGIVLATFSAPSKQTASATDLSLPTTWDPQYLIGVCILLVALFAGAFLGIWQEKTYKRYGTCWQEGLFYSHFLSLPLFAPLLPSVPSTINTLNQSPPLQLSLLSAVPSSAAFASSAGNASPVWNPSRVLDVLNFMGVDVLVELPVPRVWAWLAVNVLTQAVCVRGVNRLSSVRFFLSFYSFQPSILTKRANLNFPGEE